MAESEGEREERANTNNRGSEAKAKAAARYYFCGTLKKKVKSKVKFGSVGFSKRMDLLETQLAWRLVIGVRRYTW